MLGQFSVVGVCSLLINIYEFQKFQFKQCTSFKMGIDDKKVDTLVVDTTAFIQNAPLHEIANNIVTCKEVVDEIKNKRQLRRLIVLPYDLIVKDVFPEHIKMITEFSKKTGDYPSLSSTDIKVMALTYQLEKEKNGIDHLRNEPVLQRPIVTTENKVEIDTDVSGFFIPGINKDTHESAVNCNAEKQNSGSQSGELDCKEISPEDYEAENVCEKDKELEEKFAKLEFQDCDNDVSEEVLKIVSDSSEHSDWESSEDEDDDSGWINPSNIGVAKKQVNSKLMEEKYVAVACMTTDFAMQNVLKQINLNVSALDGRIIKQLRTYILRCYTCFKTTSIMTKHFCPKCGNNTLKKVSVSVDDSGKMQIHINPKKPLTGRGKKFSIPRIKGGKHPNNPILVEDQPMPDNRPSRLARTKNNPLDDDYIAGFSPFVMRDVNSKSAQLCIRPGMEFKHWMRKNPNEARRRRK